MYVPGIRSVPKFIFALDGPPAEFPAAVLPPAEK